MVGINHTQVSCNHAASGGGTKLLVVYHYQAYCVLGYMNWELKGMADIVLHRPCLIPNTHQYKK